MQITICGGGNAAHVLAGILASRNDLIVHIYTPFDGEAERWRRGLEAQGGLHVAGPTSDTFARPARVSALPGEVLPDSQLILLAVPAFAHRIFLEDIAPYLPEGAWVGALPARGGFDWEALAALNGRGEGRVLFGLQTLPWACRIETYGQKVNILGIKSVVDLAAWPQVHTSEIAKRLGDLFGVPQRPDGHFLSLTLANMGQVIHPGIMYGLFHSWDGRPYAEAPLFYGGVDGATAGLLEQISAEILEIKQALAARLPGLDFSSVRPLAEWLREAYANDVADASSIQSCLVTNRAYAGLRAPMRQVAGGLAPDFRARYLAEDVPYGLVVSRGPAALAGVETPGIDRVIYWAQEQMDKEYLVDGELVGRDLHETRAPQRYGYERVEQLVGELVR